jgi:hypothetical protein
MTTLHLGKSIDRSLLRPACLLLAFALLPSVQAAPDPAPPPLSNTRDGQGAMAHITTGINNSAFGTNALNKLTTGNNNAAQGNSALFSLIDGNTNTALGVLALRLNVRASGNTAVGYEALYNNISNFNTAVGYKALFSNFIQFREDAINTAVGALALLNNSEGTNNTAIGFEALVSNGEGRDNTAVGHQALCSNIGIVGDTGHGNTAVGSSALRSATGNNNIALGVNAGLNLTTGSNNIDIGNAGANTSNVIHIGSGQTRAFIAGIRGRTTGNNNAVPVVIDSAGQLGTVSSSRRFKNEIKPMDKASEAILALKPVMFHYKSDTTSTPQFGLIAEDVAQVNPDLVVRDDNGEIYSVRYEAVNAMLLNEFLKEHRKNEEQEKTIAELKSGMTALAATVKEQASQIQKVSDQLELSKAAPQMVGNDR